MNVTVQTLGPCKKLLRVELDAQEVEAGFEEVTKEFRRQATLPGFRPGKAPREMVLKLFLKDIETETKKKLIADYYKKAVDQQKLDVLGYPDIEEIQFGRGQGLQFAATVETAPEFELPDYKGLPVKREARTVTEADMARALEALRAQRANFQTVSRPAQAGDVVVVNYTGTCDGQPIIQVAPEAKSLTEQKKFWIRLEPNAFLPGFAEQLVGAAAGEKRTVKVQFPANFPNAALAGKTGLFEVEILEVKERVLPPLDDAFARSWGAEDLEKLRAGVRRDLENELKYKQDRVMRAQIIRALLDRVRFDLPESVLARETRNVVYDIVRENTQRGISSETIEKQKDEIFAAAFHSARERVTVSFLVQKIAERENIKVSDKEIARRVETLAALYQIPPQKFLKDLQKRNGLIEIYDQIASEKVMALLQEHAKVEEVPPGTLFGSEPAPANPS